MLDIGFSEIALIFTLALIVLGPEKLPRVASQVGRWIGRARGMARQFREQLEEEVNLEETRRSRPPAVMAPLPAVVPPSTPALAVGDGEASGAAPGMGTLGQLDSGAAPAAADGPRDVSQSSATLEPRGTNSPSNAQPTAAQHGATAPSSADAAPASGVDAAFQPPAEPPQPVYPDWYSHAHPTDADGNPLPPPAPEPTAADSAQQDWVGAVTPTDKPAQSTAAAGYAPPHERGI